MNYAPLYTTVQVRALSNKQTKMPNYIFFSSATNTSQQLSFHLIDSFKTLQNDA